MTGKVVVNRLFRDASVLADLELIETRNVGPDVVVPTYRLVTAT